MIDFNTILKGIKKIKSPKTIDSVTDFMKNPSSVVKKELPKVESYFKKSKTKTPTTLLGPRISLMDKKPKSYVEDRYNKINKRNEVLRDPKTYLTVDKKTANKIKDKKTSDNIMNELNRIYDMSKKGLEHIGKGSSYIAEDIPKQINAVKKHYGLEKTNLISKPDKWGKSDLNIHAPIDNLFGRGLDIFGNMISAPLHSYGETAKAYSKEKPVNMAVNAGMLAFNLSPAGAKFNALLGVDEVKKAVNYGVGKFNKYVTDPSLKKIYPAIDKLNVSSWAKDELKDAVRVPFDFAPFIIAHKVFSLATTKGVEAGELAKYDPTIEEGINKGEIKKNKKVPVKRDWVKKIKKEYDKEIEKVKNAPAKYFSNTIVDKLLPTARLEQIGDIGKGAKKPKKEEIRPKTIIVDGVEYKTRSEEGTHSKARQKKLIDAFTKQIKPKEINKEETAPMSSFKMNPEQLKKWMSLEGKEKIKYVNNLRKIKSLEDSKIAEKPKVVPEPNIVPDKNPNKEVIPFGMSEKQFNIYNRLNGVTKEKYLERFKKSKALKGVDVVPKEKQQRDVIDATRQRTEFKLEEPEALANKTGQEIIDELANLNNNEKIKKEAGSLKAITEANLKGGLSLEEALPKLEITTIPAKKIDKRTAKYKNSVIKKKLEEVEKTSKALKKEKAEAKKRIKKLEGELKRVKTMGDLKDKVLETDNIPLDEKEEVIRNIAKKANEDKVRHDYEDKELLETKKLLESDSPINDKGQTAVLAKQIKEGKINKLIEYIDKKKKYIEEEWDVLKRGGLANRLKTLGTDMSRFVHIKDYLKDEALYDNDKKSAHIKASDVYNRIHPKNISSKDANIAYQTLLFKSLKSDYEKFYEEELAKLEIETGEVPVDWGEEATENTKRRMPGGMSIQYINGMLKELNKHSNSDVKTVMDNFHRERKIELDRLKKLGVNITDEMYNNDSYFHHDILKDNRSRSTGGTSLTKRAGSLKSKKGTSKNINLNGAEVIGKLFTELFEQEATAKFKNNILASDATFKYTNGRPVKKGEIDPSLVPKNFVEYTPSELELFTIKIFPEALLKSGMTSEDIKALGGKDMRVGRSGSTYYVEKRVVEDLVRKNKNREKAKSLLREATKIFKITAILKSLIPYLSRNIYTDTLNTTMFYIPAGRKFNYIMNVLPKVASELSHYEVTGEKTPLIEDALNNNLFGTGESFTGHTEKISQLPNSKRFKEASGISGIKDSIKTLTNKGKDIMPILEALNRIGLAYELGGEKITPETALDANLKLIPYDRMNELRVGVELARPFSNWALSAVAGQASSIIENTGLFEGKSDKYAYNKEKKAVEKVGEVGQFESHKASVYQKGRNLGTTIALLTVYNLTKWYLFGNKENKEDRDKLRAERNSHKMTEWSPQAIVSLLNEAKELNVRSYIPEDYILAPNTGFTSGGGLVVFTGGSPYSPYYGIKDWIEGSIKGEGYNPIPDTLLSLWKGTDKFGNDLYSTKNLSKTAYDLDPTKPDFLKNLKKAKMEIATKYLLNNTVPLSKFVTGDSKIKRYVDKGLLNLNNKDDRRIALFLRTAPVTLIDLKKINENVNATKLAGNVYDLEKGRSAHKLQFVKDNKDNVDLWTWYQGESLRRKNLLSKEQENNLEYLRKQLRTNNIKFDENNLKNWFSSLRPEEKGYVQSNLSVIKPAEDSILDSKSLQSKLLDIDNGVKKGVDDFVLLKKAEDVVLNLTNSQISKIMNSGNPELIDMLKKNIRIVRGNSNTKDAMIAKEKLDILNKITNYKFK